MLSDNQHYYPLSFQQEMTWKLSALGSNTTLWSIHSSMLLEGELNIDLFKCAVRKLLRRHEILRAGFTTRNNKVVQFIRPLYAIDPYCSQFDVSYVSESKKNLIKTTSEKIVAKPFDLFIDDLSTWYLRRSRDRMKDGDNDAKKTLYFVLKNVAKVMAPFTPFVAENIWMKLRLDNEPESVHLCDWISTGETNFEVIEVMQQVRNVVSFGLKERQKVGLPVRQPLNSLKVKSGEINAEYLELIKDEVNVKEIVFDEEIDNEVELNTEITPELKEEGNYRELVRAIQDMRKKAGLTPSDIISLSIETDEIGKSLIKKFEADFKKTILVQEILFESNGSEEIIVDTLSFKIMIKK